MKIQNIKDKLVYSEKSITKRLLFSEDKVLNFVLNLTSGQEVPPHTHENSDLVIYVIEGAGEIIADDKVQQVVTGDVLYFTGEELFSMKNDKNENLSCFVVITPRPRLEAYSKEV
jgi:quercetin dioxygenase-like cupin family protein